MCVVDDEELIQCIDMVTLSDAFKQSSRSIKKISRESSEDFTQS